MKITNDSFFFYPSIGGIETMTELLTRDLTDKGHNVTVLTMSESKGEGEKDADFPFEVIRKPNLLQTAKAFLSADVIFQQSLMLRSLWLVLLLNKPWAVCHHGKSVMDTKEVNLNTKLQKAS